MDYVVSRGCKTFKKDKPEENDHTTISGLIINTNSTYFTFSKLNILKLRFKEEYNVAYCQANNGIMK
ncbi:hemolysin [Oceanobacillus picturae]|uniref:Hemolysin n=1 Tax=Oceanobacillus picturae TaxID=171693 RepID=A0A0U9H8Z5_9BACI|nr:hemolysin [Oceanobacillus picturae]